jgi:hypothetical protein
LQAHRHATSRTERPQVGGGHPRLKGNIVDAQEAQRSAGSFTVGILGRRRVEGGVTTGLTELARVLGAGLPTDGQLGRNREESRAGSLAYSHLKPEKTGEAAAVASVPERLGQIHGLEVN